MSKAARKTKAAAVPVTNADTTFVAGGPVAELHRSIVSELGATQRDAPAQSYEPWTVLHAAPAPDIMPTLRNLAALGAGLIVSSLIVLALI